MFYGFSKNFCSNFHETICKFLLKTYFVKYLNKKIYEIRKSCIRVF